MRDKEHPRRPGRPWKKSENQSDGKLNLDKELVIECVGCGRVFGQRGLVEQRGLVGGRAFFESIPRRGHHFPHLHLGRPDPRRVGHSEQIAHWPEPTQTLIATLDGHYSPRQTLEQQKREDSRKSQKRPNQICKCHLN